MRKYNLPEINKTYETVILANGEFPWHSIPSFILKNNNYLVCCDGAINNLVDTKILPNAIVGDCDSLSAANALHFADIIHRVTEQETNDQTKAVNFCIRQGKDKITILGATGKREDHTIANVSLLCEYLDYADVEMITNYGIFTAIDSDSQFESVPGQQVSLFCIDRCAVTTHQLKYPINNSVFTNWWQASLNEATENEFIIKIVGRMIVYRAFCH